jgi:hypothetical protein
MEGVAAQKPPAECSSPRAEIASLVIPLIVYLLIAIPVVFLTRERFNSDGVCYLHRAVLLAHGDLFNSISGYWSPGLSWSTVPLLWLGIDPLHAIHFALLLWGGAYVLAAQLFLRSILPMRTRWILASGLAIAVIAVRLATPIITPDVLLGALLLLYLYMVQRRPMIAGLFAGLAFLGKAYALPFFLIHFAITAFVRRLGWRSILYGYLAFALVAGPWIGVLSWKYGRFTFSTAATRNRFMQDVAPPNVRSHPPDVSRVPPGPFLTNMEVTDADTWPGWSPLDSRAHFLHQVHIAVEHVGQITADVWRLDHVGFVLIACLLALFSRQRDSLWLLLTGCVYAAGLLLVVYETRYVLPILMPIGLALCLKMCDKWEPRILPFIIAVCFAGSGVWGLYSLINTAHPNLTDRQIARSIVSSGLSGVFATNTPNRDRASCVAFFLNEKFIAMPPDLDATVLQSKLDADEVKFIYRWFDPNYAEGSDWPEPQTRSLIADGDWVKKRSIHLDSRRRLDIYQRTASATRPSTSMPIAGQ